MPSCRCPRCGVLRGPSGPGVRPLASVGILIGMYSEYVDLYHVHVNSEGPFVSETSKIRREDDFRFGY